MLFFQDQYKYLADKFSWHNSYEVTKFTNQEFILNLADDVIGEKCTVVGSLTCPQEHAVTLLLLLHTLVQEKAASVVLYSPYLGYQRQDVQKNRRSQGFDWADAMLYATGVEGIITIEPHNQKIISNTKVPVITQNSELLFADEMAYFVSLGFTFVFPDLGCLERSSWIQKLFPIVSYGFFLKKRNFDCIEMYDFQGIISKKVMIYDDILDSGITLIETCIALKLMQVEEIVIFVTHAFFHGQVWNELWVMGVRILYCSNSTPQADQISHPKIKVKSIAQVLNLKIKKDYEK